MASTTAGLVSVLTPVSGRVSAPLRGVRRSAVARGRKPRLWPLNLSGMVQHVRHTAHRRTEPDGTSRVAIGERCAVGRSRESGLRRNSVASPLATRAGSPSTVAIFAGAARFRSAAGVLGGCGRARRKAGRSLWALAPGPSRVPHLAVRPTAPVPISVLHGGLSLGRCLLRGGLHWVEAVEYSWRHTIDVPFFDTHWPSRLVRYW